MMLTYVQGDSRLEFQEADFPLALGVNASGEICLGGQAEANSVAWLRYDLGKLSIQPEYGKRRAAVEGVPLTGPAWLANGTSIEIDKISLNFSFENDRPVLTLVRPAVSTNEAVDRTIDPQQALRFGQKIIGGNAGHVSSARHIKRAAFGVFAILSAAAAYVLIASPVTIAVSPQESEVRITGALLVIPFGARYLVLPGHYQVSAEASGYRPAIQDVVVTYGLATDVQLALQKLPGRLSITTTPGVPAEVIIDGQSAGTTPLMAYEVSAGARELRLQAERYFPVTQTIDVTGLGQEQTLEVALTPAWGNIKIVSDPEGASVRLNGQEIGLTPLTYQPLEGAHELEIAKEGWKSLTSRFEIKAGDSLSPDTFKLQQNDGPIAVTANPTDSLVVVNGVFRGQAPLTLFLSPEQEHEIRLSKQGYTEVVRRVRPVSGKTVPLSVSLQPQYGTLFLTTSPAGAVLRINGRDSGSASQRLNLQTLPQNLEITLSGYETYRTTITPRAGISSRLDVTLKTAADAAKEEAKRGVFSPGGQKLSLIYLDKPARFTVGSSRREAARRSNESEYPVELTRSFLMSEKEVTNAEFKKFKPSHNSGAFQGASLDQASLPVVNVSWEDAARYANWLSKAEGLPPAYQDDGKRVVAIFPVTNGYRLPTEAEWEYVARFEAGQQPLNRPLQFAWGDSLPPPAKSGNYADDGPQRLGFFIPGYQDGYPATAPVGSYAASRASLYDIGGNVAEWCHDLYDIYAGQTSTPLKDPTGPTNGRFHVIKGASWRSGSITELRLSYRDYSEKPRDDIGFRIVRYAPARF